LVTFSAHATFGKRITQKPQEILSAVTYPNAPDMVGEFKYDLCGCIDSNILCKPVWWMTWCCGCIALAQLLNRFRWNACASPTDFSRQVTFAVVVGFFTGFYIIRFIFALAFRCYTDTNGNTTCAPGGQAAQVVISVSFTLFLMIMLLRTRMSFRQHYKIEGNSIADCCTMCWCSCCSIIQMLRQTHDEHENPYSCCNCWTGLPQATPDIV
jgi:Cys-rich protein (TIGR01571 family)